MNKTSIILFVTVMLLSTTISAQAVYIGNTQGGTDFPQGAFSFADAVVDYSPGIVSGTQPSDPHRGDFNALGVPDYTGVNSCASQGTCSFVSLGDGGSITLQFVDNKLTGSGTTSLDLWIFEVGPDIEDTYVDISKDGTTWSSVGKVTGSTAGIDIDAFGFGILDIFEFVRLTDDTLLDGQTGITVGADIDAVGAITTVLTPIPEPSTFLLLGGGLVGLAFAVRKRRK